MKRFLLILGFCLMVASGCIPQAPIPTPFPSETLTATSIPSPIPPTSTAMITPASPTPGAVSSIEPYLSEIQMMNETSGWAWGINEQWEGQLLHTSDEGQTWIDVTPDAVESYSSFFLDDRTAWLSAGKKLLMTSDGGNTWNVINENVWDAFVQITTDWYRFRFVDRNHGWLSAGYTAAGAHEFFYETWDGGATWQPMDFETWPQEFSNHGHYKNEFSFWSVIDVIYYDASRFMIVPGDQEGELKLYLSTDNRKTWQAVSLPSSVFSGLSFELYDRKIHRPTFFTGKDGVLPVTVWDRYQDVRHFLWYGTSDGGLTWTLDGGPTVLHDASSDPVFFSRQEVLYVCGASLCRTEDSGKTWQMPGFGSSTPKDIEHADFQIDFVNPLTGWVLIYTQNDRGERTSSHLLRTVDGGVTWDELVPVIHP